MFYGDGMITPAISVLSAVEGLEIMTPALHPFIVPVTLVIIVALFGIQKHGTARVGLFFGPVMCLWFVVLALLGAMQIAQQPGDARRAQSAARGRASSLQSRCAAFLALGAVVLAVTGTEALYADMGHFGRSPIRRAWLFFVMPALVLNYFGQGALHARRPDGDQESVLSARAVLGADSAGRARDLRDGDRVAGGHLGHVLADARGDPDGLLPAPARSSTRRSAQIGQIYVPFINWSLFVAVVLLVVGVPQVGATSAGAYGIAVTLAMLIDSILIFVVMRRLWNWPAVARGRDRGAADVHRPRLPRVELAQDPRRRLVPARDRRVVFTLLTTWKRGRGVLMDKLVGRRDAARRVHPEHRGCRRRRACREPRCS